MWILLALYCALFFSYRSLADMIRRLSTVVQRGMFWLSKSLRVRDLFNTWTFWIDFGSILAVSGVGGHAYGSWKSPENESQMWLRDFLPKNYLTSGLLRLVMNPSWSIVLPIVLCRSIPNNFCCLFKAQEMTRIPSVLPAS